MPDHVMLESSMLLHRDSANYLLALARSRVSLEAAVSGTLLRVATEDPGALGHLSRFLELPAGSIMDPTSLGRLAREIRPILQPYQPQEGRDVLSDEFKLVHDGLAEFSQDGLIAQILFEEWHFMVSQSWIFAKSRRAFDAMVEAGGTAVQMSRKAFDRLIRRTLKRKPDAPLTSADIVRAAAKWIAVGGGAALGIAGPIAGAIGSTASGLFFLVDP
jgi:hypothetical protein